MLSLRSRKSPSTYSFRRAAIVAAAATAFTSAAVLASFPAAAQQSKVTPVPASIEGVTLDTDCRTYAPKELLGDTKCLILKEQLLDAQGRALDALGSRLDAQGKALDTAITAVEKENACKRLIINAAKTGKITLPPAPPPQGQACKMAKEFGLT